MSRDKLGLTAKHRKLGFCLFRGIKMLVFVAFFALCIKDSHSVHFIHTEISDFIVLFIIGGEIVILVVPNQRIRADRVFLSVRAVMLFARKGVVEVFEANLLIL